MPLAAIDENPFRGIPLLAVEVLSPSTRAWDLGLKRLKYAEAGLGWFWVVDVDDRTLTVLRLVDGGYEEEAVVRGDEPYEAPPPLHVKLAPGDLTET